MCVPHFITNFSRTEKKFLLSGEKYEALMLIIGDKLKPDKFSKATVHSIYFDTPDFRLIRNSVYHEGFKEKLRLRAYGQVGEETPLFLEIKRKIKGVVYKRRTVISTAEARQYFERGVLPHNGQIMREIDYAYNFYGRPAANVKISCERESFVLKNDENIRITFDSEILYDFHNMNLSQKSGQSLLRSDERLMEIKTSSAIPLWLCEVLNKNEIFPRPFSKYARSWEKEKGEKFL